MRTNNSEQIGGNGRQLKSFLALIVFALMFSFNTNVTAQDALEADSTSFFSFKRVSNGISQLFSSVVEDDVANNLNNSQDELIVLGVRYRNHVVKGLDSVQNQLDQQNSEDVAAEIIGMPLVYPNPFRQSTSTGGHLFYTLSKDMDIEIHVYNMLAHRVFKQTFKTGAEGAAKGENKLKINNESFGGNNNLSAGIYFFVFIHEGKVLGKTKVAVKP